MRGVILVLSFVFCASAASAQTRTFTIGQDGIVVSNDTVLLQSILNVQQQLFSLQQQQIELQKQLLAVSTDTNKQVTQMNTSFAQTLANVGLFTAKYIAPAVITWLAAKGKI